MLVCPRENFNNETIVIETIDGHQCTISMDDIERANFCDMYDHATIYLKPESSLAELLGTQTIKTMDKQAFSEFYFGFDITMVSEDEDYSYLDEGLDYLHMAKYESRYGKPHPHLLPPFPK